MSTPTFQTSLFSNLVMLTRNDDRLTMTGCLCRDVKAQHFELNTPVTIKLDELKDSLPDFWAPWPTLNHDKVRDMYGADREEAMKLIETRAVSPVILPYGSCSIYQLRLLTPMTPVLCLVPTCNLEGVNARAVQFAERAVFRQHMVQPLTKKITSNTGIDPRELSPDCWHEILGRLEHICQFQPCMMNPVKTATDAVNDMNLHSGNIYHIVRQDYFRRILKKGETVTVHILPQNVGRGYHYNYTGEVKDVDTDGVILKHGIGHRDTDYIKYTVIDRIEHQ